MGDIVKIYMGNAPKELLDESKRLREIRLKECRKEYLEQTRNAQFKYYCSVCLIIRDENEYLEEWLRWHIGQGVEHFYIYDHGSKQPVKEFVQSLGADVSEKITVIDWSGKHKDAQPEAYNDCLNRYRGESRWIGFLGADEQVRVKTGQSLPEFLKGYEDYAAVFAVWLVYNADGQRYHTEGTLRKRFTRVSRDDQGANKMGKVFVQPFYMTDMVIHNGRAADGFEVVDEHCRVFNKIKAAGCKTAAFIFFRSSVFRPIQEWVGQSAAT